MRVALYLRLSDEDHDKLSIEELSESIKNQEKMLRNYAIENNWEIFDVYQDEDYSGADRDRPNFNKMIKECEKGNIDIVLVKTQSRFARDIELIDKYVHNKFYEWNVRFMTYLEKIDNTKKETKKTSQITSMVDEWYIEDTSVNIRATLKSKRENGEFTGSFAPYGYQKDPENKNHLLVDTIVSPIIKRIYQEYLLGYSFKKIANNLNQDNILSPLEYKRLNGCKLQIPITKKYERYHSIKQTGTYKLDIAYYNKEKKPIKNLITYQYISIPSKYFSYTLKNYTNMKITLYYTLETNINEKDFQPKDWIKININDTIPSNITCIAIYTKELQPNQVLSYQFEIELKENKTHQDYNFILHHYLNKKRTNLEFIINIRKQYKWSIQTIKNILTNEFYIGTLVQFKSTHVSYKNHTVIHNDKSKWIRAYNTHEAIIEKRIWNKVQEKLKCCARSTSNGNIHPLSNKVFCLECKKSFMKCGKNNSNGYSYLCCRDKLEKWNNCNNKKYLQEEVMHTFLLKKINQFINTLFDSKEYQKLANNYKQKSLNTTSEINFLSKQIEIKNNYFINLFETHAKGLLNDDEFLLLKTKYQDEIETLKTRITSIESNKKQTIKKQEITEILKLDYLDSNFINTFIDKIFIGPYNKKNNTRKIEIIWNLKDY